PHGVCCSIPMLLDNRPVEMPLWLVVPPDRKLLFGVDAFEPWTVVLNVGSHAARASATLRSEICGLIRAICTPRLLSSASRTASSMVSVRTGATDVCAGADGGARAAAPAINNAAKMEVVRMFTIQLCSISMARL